MSWLDDLLRALSASPAAPVQRVDPTRMEIQQKFQMQDNLKVGDPERPPRIPTVQPLWTEPSTEMVLNSVTGLMEPRRRHFTGEEQKKHQMKIRAANIERERVYNEEAAKRSTARPYPAPEIIENPGQFMRNW